MRELIKSPIDSFRFLPLLLVLLGLTTAHATNRVVTNLGDSGAGSLRDMIAASIAGDTITFAPGLTGHIDLTSGELPISRDLTIIGPGATNLTVRAIATSRILNISATTASLSGLTLSQGKTYDNTGGAGILNGAVLSLSHCVVSGNTTYMPGTGSVSGGGVHNFGTLTADSCVFSGNSGGYGPSGGGGGIYNTGVMSLTNCTISGNTTYSQAGGGIYNSGTLTLLSCTVAGNGGSSSLAGGGIWNSATLTLRNSTVSANSAEREGPGLRTQGSATLQ